MTDPGSYTISLSSRAFSTPLFGNGSATSFSFFGRQLLSSGVEVSGFAYGGFPNTTTFLGVEANRIDFLGGVAAAQAGDFAVARLQPEGIVSPYGDVIPLEGMQVRWRRGNQGFAVFAGASKFLVSLPQQPKQRPNIGGFEYLTSFGRNDIGGMVTVVEHPVYDDPAIHRDHDALLRVSYVREVSPTASLFADAFGGRGPGFRAGGSANFQLGRFSLSGYHFDRALPVISIFNPGESGIESTGSYRPTEWSTVNAQLFYVTQDATTTKRELRGQAGYGYSFGSGAPYIYVSYGREQLSVSSFDQDISSIGNRFSASATRASQSGFSSLTLEHVRYHEQDTPDRTQLVVTDQRVVRFTSFLESELVLQREPKVWGATLQSAVELQWRGPYFLVVGGGLAYLETPLATGEGLLRIGISRRSATNGIYGRTEARIPVGIGLPRSRLNRESVTLDVGARFGLQDIRNMRAALAPVVAPNQFGTIEGRVAMGDKGLPNLTVSVNGQAATVTDASGLFHTGRLPIGAANVSIDPLQLEPGIAVVGDSTVNVTVQPRQATRVDFKLAQFSTFRGSLVVCEGEQKRALPGAKIALVAGESAIQLDVAPSGGFQADNIPPGRYDIVIDPTSVPGVSARDIPRLSVDLTHDVLGYVIGLRCPQPAQIARAPEPRVEPAPATTSLGEDPRRLVEQEDFSAALKAFEAAKPIANPAERFFYAVALYETGHYAEAKRELAASEVPDTDEGRRYRAKIEGAIVWSQTPE